MFDLKKIVRTHAVSSVLVATPELLLQEALAVVEDFNTVLLDSPQLRGISQRFCAVTGNLLMVNGESSLHRALERAVIAHAGACCGTSDPEAKSRAFIDALLKSLPLFTREVIWGEGEYDWVTIELFSESLQDWIRDKKIQRIAVVSLPSPDEHPLAQYFKFDEGTGEPLLNRMAINRLIGYQTSGYWRFGRDV